MNEYLLFALLISATIILAYVLGSINGALIISKVIYRKDIREYGSGNAGLTNFYRVFGKGGVSLVILIDVLKTIVPVLFGGWLFDSFFHPPRELILPFDMAIDNLLFGRTLAGLAVVLGHCFPVFYMFKGGKGVMALGCIVFIIDWRLALLAWGVFVFIVLITRYVSLGAILGSSTFAISMIVSKLGGIPEISCVTLFVLLIILRHSENIKRLIAGEESKFNLTRKKSVQSTKAGEEN